MNNLCSAFLARFSCFAKLRLCAAFAHTRARSQALQNWAENAEPAGVDPEIREVAAPVGDGARRVIVAPTAPANDAVRARACSPVISKCTCLVARSIPIPAPLPNIPTHVVKS